MGQSGRVGILDPEGGSSPFLDDPHHVLDRPHMSVNPQLGRGCSSRACGLTAVASPARAQLARAVYGARIAESDRAISSRPAHRDKWSADFGGSGPAQRARLFIFSPVSPTFVPQPLANLIKSGSDLIALPWRSILHAIPDFVQAFAHPLAMLAPPLPFLTITGAALWAWTVAGTSLRAWPLDLNEMAVDARFLFQRAGVSRARQHSQGEKAGSENGSESSHEAPPYMTRRERVQCGTHSGRAAIGYRLFCPQRFEALFVVDEGV